LQHCKEPSCAASTGRFWRIQRYFVAQGNLSAFDSDLFNDLLQKLLFVADLLGAKPLLHLSDVGIHQTSRNREDFGRRVILLLQTGLGL